ncbi:hypothetical protein GCM10009647_080160 [Streptomyces sanglieri]
MVAHIAEGFLGGVQAGLQAWTPHADVTGQKSRGQPASRDGNEPAGPQAAGHGAQCRFLVPDAVEAVSDPDQIRGIRRSELTRGLPQASDDPTSYSLRHRARADPLQGAGRLVDSDNLGVRKSVCQQTRDHPRPAADVQHPVDGRASATVGPQQIPQPVHRLCEGGSLQACLTFLVHTQHVPLDVLIVMCVHESSSSSSTDGVHYLLGPGAAAPSR